MRVEARVVRDVDWSVGLLATCFGSIINDRTAVKSRSLTGKMAAEAGGMPSNESEIGTGSEDSEVIVLFMGDVDYIYLS